MYPVRAPVPVYVGNLYYDLHIIPVRHAICGGKYREQAMSFRAPLWRLRAVICDIVYHCES